MITTLFKKIYLKSAQKGDILLSVIVFSAIAVTVTIALVNWGATVLSSVRQVQAREQALQIAEAGIDYYRWHLAHAPNDFQDGTGQDGPYVHDFKDKNGNVIGSYTLTIIPPDEGSTFVTVQSQGTVISRGSVSRTIKVTMAMPSWAQYAVVANDVMYFGPNTNVYGSTHSNYGIHFDGTAYGVVSSAVSSWFDPDYNKTQFGVYTLTPPPDPTPPAPVPSKPNVFKAGRRFPVPAVDFSGLNGALANLKSLSQLTGLYLESSGASGYHIVLKTNDTFDLYKVTALMPVPTGCSEAGTQWGTWSIQSEELIRSYNIPSNGIIFAEDNVWVDGQIDGTRITIATGILPDPGIDQQPSITINRNLTYSNMDGTDAIGLMAQGNINVGLNSPDNLTIHAAMIAQNQRVGRYHYSVTACGATAKRTNLTLYGMIATDDRYGFSYTDQSGYKNRNITYDPNLLYSPPPSFPLTTNQYQILSWQEVN